MPLVNAEDLDTSPPDYLVEGMIPLVGAGFIWGKSRAGKSLLTNGELALAIANGVPFFGREVAQGSVAICLGEGLYDAGVRLKARMAREQNDRIAIGTQLSEKFGLDSVKQWLDEQPPYTDDNLFYMTEPFILPLANGGEPTQSLRAAADSLSQIPNLQLVIIDALSDFTPSLSISNDASANRVVAGLKFLVRELDCAVLAVAHPTGNGAKMLGAGRLFNAADFVIQVQPDEGTGRIPSGANVICEKNKYGKPFEPFSYYIEQCAWHEPYLDDEGNPTDEIALVESATIRARQSVSQVRFDNSSQPRRQPKLPQFVEPENATRRKRNGIRARKTVTTPKEQEQS
jgi:hypothetical protein